MILETERLILRKPRMSDWKDVVEACNNISVSRNLLKVPYPYKKKDAQDWINETFKLWKKKENYEFFIELKSEKKIIGALSLRVDEHNKIGNTGSWINSKYWKNGYVTEAKIVLNDFAFSKLNLRKLESEAFSDNPASNTMQKRMGYKCEGRRIKKVISKATGKIHDENMYGLLKEEWKKIVSKLKKHLKEKIKKLEVKK